MIIARVGLREHCYDLAFHLRREVQYVCAMLMLAEESTHEHAAAE